MIHTQLCPEPLTYDNAMQDAQCIPTTQTHSNIQSATQTVSQACRLYKQPDSTSASIEIRKKMLSLSVSSEVATTTTHKKGDAGTSSVSSSALTKQSASRIGGTSMLPCATVEHTAWSAYTAAHRAAHAHQQHLDRQHSRLMYTEHVPATSGAQQGPTHQRCHLCCRRATHTPLVLCGGPS